MQMNFSWGMDDIQIIFLGWRFRLLFWTIPIKIPLILLPLHAGRIIDSNRAIWVILWTLSASYMHRSSSFGHGTDLDSWSMQFCSINFHEYIPRTKAYFSLVLINNLMKKLIFQGYILIHDEKEFTDAMIQLVSVPFISFSHSQWVLFHLTAPEGGRKRLSFLVSTLFWSGRFYHQAYTLPHPRPFGFANGVPSSRFPTTADMSSATVYLLSIAHRVYLADLTELLHAPPKWELSFAPLTGAPIFRRWRCSKNTCTILFWQILCRFRCCIGLVNK